MTCCCFWFSQPAMETTRNENGSRPARIRRDYHATSSLFGCRRHESNLWTLRCAISQSTFKELAKQVGFSIELVPTKHDLLARPRRQSRRREPPLFRPLL